MVKINKEEQIKKHLGIRGLIKLTRIMNNLRNSLCDDCRAKLDKAGGKLDNPKDYCEDCRPKATEKLNKIERLCK